MLMLFTSAEGAEMDKRLATTIAPSPSDRAGDRDRQKAAARLGQAFAQGYLEMDEYEERVKVVFRTHTTGELQKLLADLPLDRIRRADPRRRAARIAAGCAFTSAPTSRWPSSCSQSGPRSP